MIWVIARREFAAMFLAPLAWILLAVIQVILGWLFFTNLDSFSMWQPQLMQLENTPGVTDIVVTPLMQVAVIILLMVMPLLTMRSFAEEKRNRSLTLLISKDHRRQRSTSVFPQLDTGSDQHIVQTSPTPERLRQPTQPLEYLLLQVGQGLGGRARVELEGRRLGCTRFFGRRASLAGLRALPFRTGLLRRCHRLPSRANWRST